MSVEGDNARPDLLGEMGETINKAVVGLGILDLDVSGISTLLVKLADDHGNTFTNQKPDLQRVKAFIGEHGMVTAGEENMAEGDPIIIIDNLGWASRSSGEVDPVQIKLGKVVGGFDKSGYFRIEYINIAEIGNKSPEIAPLQISEMKSLMCHGDYNRYLPLRDFSLDKLSD